MCVWVCMCSWNDACSGDGKLCLAKNINNTAICAFNDDSCLISNNICKSTGVAKQLSPTTCNLKSSLTTYLPSASWVSLIIYMPAQICFHSNVTTLLAILWPVISVLIVYKTLRVLITESIKSKCSYSKLLVYGYFVKYS